MSDLQAVGPDSDSGSAGPTSSAASVSLFDDESWRPTWETIHPRDRARFLLPDRTRKLVDAIDRAAGGLSLNVATELLVVRELLNVMEKTP